MVHRGNRVNVLSRSAAAVCNSGNGVDWPVNWSDYYSRYFTLFAPQPSWNSFPNDFRLQSSVFDVYNYTLPQSSWSDARYGGDVFAPLLAVAASRVSPLAAPPSARAPERPPLDKVNYDSAAGEGLVTDIVKYVKSYSTGYCAKYVSDALERMKISTGIRGNANQMADILRKNENFQEIQVAPEDLAKLPAGCIIVYKPNTAEFRGWGQIYGHVEITGGDGYGYSDYKREITPSAYVEAVFVPVSSD